MHAGEKLPTVATRVLPTTTFAQTLTGDVIARTSVGKRIKVRAMTAIEENSTEPPMRRTFNQQDLRVGLPRIVSAELTRGVEPDAARTTLAQVGSTKRVPEMATTPNSRSRATAGASKRPHTFRRAS